MAGMAEYGYGFDYDPIEAAKKRTMSQSAQSYFPAANLNQFSDNAILSGLGTFAATAGSIFKPGFDPDNPLGTPTPSPTPRPTPAPPTTTSFNLPAVANLRGATGLTPVNQWNQQFQAGQIKAPMVQR